MKKIKQLKNLSIKTLVIDKSMVIEKGGDQNFGTKKYVAIEKGGD
jgi:hypothetical protein